MATKKENNLDTKSTLVNADKIRIINSEDSNDSESISYQNLITNLNSDLTIPTNPIISAHDPAGSYTITDSDGYTHIINSATGTITLPTLADNYNRIITIIRDVADSSTPIIIDGEGAETIAGNTSEYLYGKYAVMSLMASQDAGEWVYVGNPYDPYVFEYSSTSNITGWAVNASWEYITGVSLSLEAGTYDIYYFGIMDIRYSTSLNDMQSGLSTETASGVIANISDSKSRVYSLNGSTIEIFPFSKSFRYTTGSTVTLYLKCFCSGTGSITSSSLNGTQGTTLITAKRVF